MSFEFLLKQQVTIFRLKTQLTLLKIKKPSCR